jgi:hypothetical protein
MIKREPRVVKKPYIAPGFIKKYKCEFLEKSVINKTQRVFASD